MEKKDRLAKALAYLKMKGLAESQVDAARKMNAAESELTRRTLIPRQHVVFNCCHSLIV